MRLTEKRVLVNLPVGLYNDLKQIASKELRSVSSLIRESVLHRVEETLSAADKMLIKRGRKEFREGKGTDWRKVLPKNRSKDR